MYKNNIFKNMSSSCLIFINNFTNFYFGKNTISNSVKRTCTVICKEILMTGSGVSLQYNNPKRPKVDAIPGT